MRSGRHEGFALSELLFVVAIVDIAAAVANPRWSSRNSKKLNVVAEEVGNVLRFAIERGRSGAFEFAPHAHRLLPVAQRGDGAAMIDPIAPSAA